MIRVAAITAAVIVAGLLPVLADEPKKDNEEAIPAAMKPYAVKLLEIAKTYERFGRVDDEIRWAPFLCRMPQPGKAHFSTSKDDETHGRKLYSLFAKDHKAYVQTHALAKDVKTAEVGQAIVKESWIPEETKIEGRPQPIVRKTNPDGKLEFEHNDHFLPYAQKNGKWYKASKPAGLFVMMKFDPKTPETDQGWIYGTVSADRKHVTGMGKIASCMECHQKARHDRLFGIGVKAEGGD